jgi:peptide/nickel transport system substrate-binding protein
MKRRDVLKSAAAVSAALAAPKVVKAEGARTVTFVPHADLASLDPVWTTADITRNYSLAVFDTLFGYDAQFNVQPQMVDGVKTESDGLTWELTLRDGLKFHDGEKVLARDCVATINRFSKRNPFGQAMMKRVAELSAPSDTAIRFRLNKPFPLLQNALAEVYCAIMPTRLAETDPLKQIPEAIGSGPFKFLADERIPGQRVAFAKNAAYVPRSSGIPSFNAGPKIVNIDRAVWSFIPDSATSAAALAQGEIDWWEQPTIDLVAQLKKNPALTVTVKDRTGEIACMRFNHLLPPFDNAAIRRVVVSAIDQKEIIEAYAGAEPSLIKTDVGIFVPGTPMASTVGLEITRGPKDINKIKADLIAAGYKGEKIVILAATTLPNIWAEAQVASDLLTRIGFNVDFQALEWGSVVQRRASREPIDKGGWNIFYTYLGGFGNISPAPDIAIRGNGTSAWFGWPTNPKMEALYDAWFEAPDVPAQKKIVDEMQALFWQDPPFAPMGMYDQPTAFNKRLTDVPDGWPQFYGLKKNS